MNETDSGKGLIHIYTGDGKGKTTSAIGLSVRATSRGLRTLFIQFFKEKDPNNEIGLLKQIGVTVFVFENIKSPLFYPNIDRSHLRHETLSVLQDIKGLLLHDQFDLIVLDEFICLVSEGILSEEEAIKFAQDIQEKSEIVLTGKGASKGLIEIADYVTFMKKIKHPFGANLTARRGIEF